MGAGGTEEITTFEAGYNGQGKAVAKAGVDASVRGYKLWRTGISLETRPILCHP